MDFNLRGRGDATRQRPLICLDHTVEFLVCGTTAVDESDLFPKRWKSLWLIGYDGEHSDRWDPARRILNYGEEANASISAWCSTCDLFAHEETSNAGFVSRFVRCRPVPCQARRSAYRLAIVGTIANS
jgi:hypothetical protein